MKRDQKNMTKLLVGVIAALVAVLAVLVVVLVLTPSATITSHSAQAEVEAEQKALKEAEKEGYYDTDVIEVVDLSALIGLDLTSALTEIGHGAEIDGDPKLVAGGLKEVTVLLGEESASIDTGMALTHLYLDKAGVVVSASYRININDLSCATLPFDRIERLLEGAGLTSIVPDPVVAPEKEEYAHYDSTGKTIDEERFQFVGTGTDEAGHAFDWGVLLDYDYAQAIEENNLAKTVRTVEVAISSAS